MDFMVSLQFDAQDLKEAMPHVPAEQEHLQQLKGQGIVQTVYVASDFLQVWIWMKGAAQAEIQELLSTFPLYPYMRRIQITPLGRIA